PVPFAKGKSPSAHRDQRRIGEMRRLVEGSERKAVLREEKLRHRRIADTKGERKRGAVVRSERQLNGRGDRTGGGEGGDALAARVRLQRGERVPHPGAKFRPRLHAARRHFAADPEMKRRLEEPGEPAGALHVAV